MPLSRSLYLAPELVKVRAREYPLVTALVGDLVRQILDGKRKRADAAPLLVRLLEQTGGGSAAMLARLEEGIAQFDELAPGGWARWKLALSRSHRAEGLSRYTELLLALVFTRDGFRVEAFEPEGAIGKFGDLLVNIDGERVVVETSTPGPHSADWVEDAMDRLSSGLSRVESGLTIDVRGYDALSFDPQGEWGARNPPVTAQQVEDLINEFCRLAEKIEPHSVPVGVVEPREGQPVLITVIGAGDEIPTRTAVKSSWNRSGLIPNVDRLVKKILDERKHLPIDRPGMILVDLRNWHDFWNADHYLKQVADRVRQRTSLPELIGSFISDSRDLVFERRVLHASAWTKQPAGRRFFDAWLREDGDRDLRTE
jgi:hypothetical protein